jgi:hypothetical protein
MARACAIHPEDPNVVAVGFGGRVGRGKESGGGMVRVYTYYTGEQLMSFSVVFVFVLLISL